MRIDQAGRSSPVFLSTYNLLNLLRQTAELGLIAMAMTILIISGEFDLSVGAIYAVAGVVTGLLAEHFGLEMRTLMSVFGAQLLSQPISVMGTYCAIPRWVHAVTHGRLRVVRSRRTSPSVS